MSVSRWPTGICTDAKGQNLGEFIMPDPTKAHTYFNDFDLYTATDWTVTEVGNATQAITDGDGGLLLITNAAADNDASSQQLVNETFLFEAGKQLWFKARFKVSDATQSDFVVGLQIRDTTPFDVTDGVFFQKDDGDANLDFYVEKNNTASSALAVATVVSNTYLSVGFYYDGKSSVQYFVNDAAMGSLATTNLPDDEDMTVSFSIMNGEAVAKTMTVDYLMVAKAR